MLKPSPSLQPKSKLLTFSPSNILQTPYSTIQPRQSDIDNIELISQDSLQISHQRSGKETHKNDSVHLEIQLDDGKVQMIYPKINDDPAYLARSFCQRHQLDQQMLAVLTENIKKTILRLKNTSNKNKQKRIATQPTQYHPKQKHNYKFDTNTKNKPFNSKDFFKKKQQHQQSVEFSNQFQINQQKIKRFAGQYVQSTHSKENLLSQKIFNQKQTQKSTKRQNHSHFDSTRIQSSVRKTQPFDDHQFRKALFNKQNQAFTSSSFDFLSQKNKLKQIKKKDKILVFMKRNSNFQPQINLSSKKNLSNQSYEQRPKNSIQKSCQKDLRNRKAVSLSSVQSSKGSIPKHYFKLQTLQQKQKKIVQYSLKNLGQNAQSLSKQVKISSTKSILNLSSHPSKNTQKLYENQKQKAFKSIFRLLDDDGDGIISILNINLINGIEQKLIQILFPVLEELQILETELNQNQFCDAIDKLLGSLSVDEKGYLLKYCQNLSKEEKRKHQSEPLKTTMTPISQLLVTRTQRNNMNVYEYSKIRQELKQQKLQQQRIIKQRSLMRNCTFHPKTNPKRAIYF